MRRIWHLPLALLVAAGIACATTPAIRADDGQNGQSQSVGTASPSNQAVAINTKDDSSIFKFAFSIKQVVGSAVAPTNLAFAYAQCSDCRTVAVAIQIVLVESDAHYTAPVNQAVAVNYLCNACETLAFAYQFVVQAGYPVHITNAGMHLIDRIYAEIERVGHDKDLSFAQLQAQLKDLILQLQNVLSDSRYVAPDNPAPPGNENQGEPTPSPSASTQSASPSPNGTSSSSPTATPSSATTAQPTP